MKVKRTSPAPETPSPERYSAPALEKGLDLLEILAEEPGGLAQAQLAARAGRSVSEIYRMADVLVRRGFVTRDAQSGLYSLSLRLFTLALRHPPVARLRHAALPVMHDLAARIGQSCHLVVLEEPCIAVIEEAVPQAPMVFSVRPGARFPLSARYASARVLAAFQPLARRSALADAFARADGGPAAGILARLAALHGTGHVLAPSEVTAGVWDVSVPVRDHEGHALAALSVPLLMSAGDADKAAHVRDALEDAARGIAAQLGT